MQITKTMYGGYFGNDPVPRLVETSTYANDGGTSAPIASGNTSPVEKNDCTVRALSNAAGVTYESAHEFMRVYAGRVSRRGSTVSNLTKAYERVGAKNITFSGKYRYWCSKFANNCSVTDKGLTLKTFLANNPIGRFVVVVTGHAVCVVDGRLVDTTRVSGKKHVIASYDFTKANRINSALADVE